jgi:hypothetical protein
MWVLLCRKVNIKRAVWHTDLEQPHDAVSDSFYKSFGKQYIDAGFLFPFENSLN